MKTLFIISMLILSIRSGAQTDTVKAANVTVIGATGLTGPQGIKGATGATGKTGPAGITTTDSTKTVIVLGPGLFNPKPSASLDTVYINLTATNVLFQSQPTQIAKAGQKVFTFLNMPLNLDNFMIFRNGVYQSSRRFTKVGNDVTIPGAAEGDEIEYRKLR